MHPPRHLSGQKTARLPPGTGHGASTRSRFKHSGPLGGAGPPAIWEGLGPPASRSRYPCSLHREVRDRRGTV